MVSISPLKLNFLSPKPSLCPLWLFCCLSLPSSPNAAPCLWDLDLLTLLWMSSVSHSWFSAHIDCPPLPWSTLKPFHPLIHLSPQTFSSFPLICVRSLLATLTHFPASFTILVAPIIVSHDWIRSIPLSLNWCIIYSHREQNKDQEVFIFFSQFASNNSRSPIVVVFSDRWVQDVISFQRMHQV